MFSETITKPSSTTTTTTTTTAAAAAATTTATTTKMTPTETTIEVAEAEAKANVLAETATETTAASQPSILRNILFRNVLPTDLPAIYKLEKASYPKDEAASKSQIQYRQHHAAPFFRCAVYLPSQEDEEESPWMLDDLDTVEEGEPEGSLPTSENNNNNNYDDIHSDETVAPIVSKLPPRSTRGNSFNEMGVIIGFITATRCSSFTAKSMSTHDSSGALLAIHSIVVQKEYRHLGVGKAMVKDYLDLINTYMEEKMANNATSIINGRLIEKIVLLSKINNLPFYIKLGFQVLGKSQIEHGSEDWYDCAQPIPVVEAYQKKRRKQQESVKRNGSIGNSLCWIIDSFAIPIHLSSYNGNSDISMNESSKNLSNTSPPVISYKRGSGNPAAVVMVPHPSPMTKNINHSHHRSYSNSSIANSENGDKVISDESNAFCNFDPISEDNITWMKNIAKEFNLSETAFIWKYSHNETVRKGLTLEDLNNVVESKIEDEQSVGGDIHYNIRFYTGNGTEVDLCGHATLAASSVIFQRLGKEVKNSVEGITFHANKDVILKAKRNQIGNASNNLRNNITNAGTTRPGFTIYNNQPMNIVMEFPTRILNEFENGSPQYNSVISMLNNSLFQYPNDDGENVLKIQDHVKFVGVDDHVDDLLIELSSEAFANIPRYSEDINFKPMLDLEVYNRGIILCCEMSEDYRMYGETADFMSRFFGPKVGIEEDPVTGSAHCVLGPYFSNKLGKEKIVGAQKSLRGGIVECELIDENLILIAGTAVTTMSGNLFM